MALKVLTLSHTALFLRIASFVAKLRKNNTIESTYMWRCVQQSVAERSSREGQVQRRITSLEQERDRLLHEAEDLRQKMAGAARALQRSQHLEQSLKVEHYKHMLGDVSINV